jgi:hypothetical protein
MYFTTHRIEHNGNLLAIEFHVRETLDEMQNMRGIDRLVALRSAHRAADISAAHYGSCVAHMGIGYRVSTMPLPECTC